MLSFDTTLTRTRTRDALELLALASSAEGDEEIDGEEEIEVEVEVFFNPGYEDAGTYFEPPSGEDPEITSVMRTCEDGTEVEISDSLLDGELRDLVGQAWDYQSDYSDGVDEDAYDRSRDEAMEDDYDDRF